MDCVPLLHLDLPGTGYDISAELALLEERVRAHGLTSFAEAQQTVSASRFA
jgi:hypothetical protein